MEPDCFWPYIVRNTAGFVPQSSKSSSWLSQVSGCQ
jgi:hypothetical protein